MFTIVYLFWCRVLERRLDDPNYDSLTQSTKRKEKKEMNDVSVVVVDSVDTVVRPVAEATVESDTDTNDTDNDPNDNSNDDRVTWSNHAQQRTYSDGDDGDDSITSTYGDGDDIIDISETITSAKKPYIYKTYRDACNGSKKPSNGSKKPCSESTITYGRNPHHVSNRRRTLPNSRQVSSE